MKLFLDTANVTEIREAAAWGILDGVTTNPTLIAKEGRDYHDTLREISGIVGEHAVVNGEVISTACSEMLAEARVLAKLSDRMVVKIPMIPEGLKAVSALRVEGIRTNVTLCFSATQALLAAKAGATYISPFLGRLDDISHVGMELIEQIRTIYDNYGLTTELLAASLRHPLHVLECALAGADIATMPFDVMKKLFAHPLTDSGLQRFLKDWNDLQSRIRK